MNIGRATFGVVAFWWILHAAVQTLDLSGRLPMGTYPIFLVAAAVLGPPGTWL